MPVLDSAIYDPIDTILNFVRVIANDCQVSLSGELLADTEPYTFTILSLAFRKLCDRLGNNNVEDFPAEYIMNSLAAMPTPANQDPGTQTYINSVGYFDGINFNSTPFLPDNIEVPLKLWERASGQNAQFIPMYPIGGGLPSRAKTSLFREWEWRGDAIWLTGAIQVNDIRLRYRRRFPDFSTTPPPDGTQPIPIINCAVALAYLAVEIFSTGRGGVMNDQFLAERESAIKQLINKTTRKKQYGNYRRRPYSRRGTNRLTW